MSDTTYSNLFNPYNNKLERTSSSDTIDVAGVPTSTTTSSGLESSSFNIPETLGDKKISTGDDIDNIWIKSWIKSLNYKPGISGFMIDGLTGNVEFGNGKFRGDITGASGTFSGALIGGSLHIPDITTVNSFHVDSTGNIWSGATTFNISTNPFAVSSNGTLRATLGSIGGWEIQSTLLRSASSGVRVELNKGDNRISIFDATNEKVVMGYLNGLPKNDGTGNWGVGDYGFWARSGDKLSIDGDGEYINGDWIVKNDAAYLINNASNQTIVRLGTDTGEKGLFIYNTSGTQLAKLISTSIFIGETNKYLSYDTVNGLIIRGSITADIGYIGGSASGWTITTGKIYGGSGSAFSGLIQGTGTTKAFFAGATDNAGTSAQFYVTAAGDLVAKSATISGYKLFEAIVASDGTGDYTTIYGALAAGKKRIFVRNGAYYDETRWNLDTTGMIIQGESRDGVLIKFLRDSGLKSIYITKSITLSSLSLTSFNFSDTQVKVFDTFPSKIDTTKWNETDPLSLINYYAENTNSLFFSLPHINNVSWNGTYLESVSSITGGLAVFTSTFQWIVAGANEAIIGLGLYFNSSNYAYFTSRSSIGGVKLQIVQFGSSVYDYETGVAAFSYAKWKITYDFSSYDIKFYGHNGSSWIQLGTTQTFNLGATVYARITASDNNTYTNCDGLYVSFIALSNSDDVYGTTYSQTLIDITTYDRSNFSNLNLRNDRGIIFRSSYTNNSTLKDIYFNYNNDSDVCYCNAIYNFDGVDISNCFIDATSLPVTSNKIKFIYGLGNSTISNIRIESGVEDVSYKIESSSIFNNCYFKFQELSLQSNCNSCQFISNGYAPTGYFVSVDSTEISIRNCQFILDNSYDLLKITSANCSVTCNYFDGGKKIIMDAISTGFLGTQFIANSWTSGYTSAAIDLEITSDFTSTIVTNNTLRNNSGGGSTPTITDGGTSSTIANNELVP